MRAAIVTNAFQHSGGKPKISLFETMYLLRRNAAFAACDHGFGGAVRKQEARVDSTKRATLPTTRPRTQQVQVRAGRSRIRFDCGIVLKSVGLACTECQEKPKHPLFRNAVTGIYMFDCTLFDTIRR
jgi:hypothetical protein